MKIWYLPIIAVSLFLGSNAIAQDMSKRIETLENSDYFGFDLRTVQNIALEDCKAICLGDNRCKAFTYNVKAQWCFLKSDYNQINSFDGAIAGRVIEGHSEPEIGAAPILSFVPASYVDDARRYRQINATRNANQIDKGADALIASGQSALNDGNSDSALRSFAAAAAADPDRSSSWLSLAHTAMDFNTTDSKLDQALRSLAVSASLTAYETSRTTTSRADALATLGTAFENVQAWRPALNAYRASLALKENSDLRATYVDLRNRQGFRIVDNSVDAESTTPRLCAQFSEDLLKGFDYSSFVSVKDLPDVTVEAEKRQICVDGLSHGMRYSVTFRTGLPSAIDENLETPVELDIYIRDRQPLARFSGNAFVLPAKGRQGIPLLSVNAAKAKLALFRIGERALTQVLGRSEFLSQLDNYSLESIRDDAGEPVWQGEVDIDIQLNREVMTSIPVDEMLPQRKAGVYVLTAIPEGDNSENWEAKATQWFVISDIGISTFAGSDGLSVFLRSLETAQPLGEISLTLLARNNGILGEAVTDDQGRADFPAGLMRGVAGLAPVALMAKQGTDNFVFLDLTRGGFDLSDRGVTGRPAPGGIDVMASTERGIYRPGETIELSALVRDDTAKAIDDMPLTVILQRPDGVEDRRVISDGGAEGGHAVSFPLPLNALTGSWTAYLHTDPDRPALAQTTVLVEDFQPDRVEFDLNVAGGALSATNTVDVGVTGRYLYGAPAAGLKATGSMVIKTTRQQASLPGYVFGLEDENAESLRQDVNISGPLDEQGNATIKLALDDAPSSTRFLEAELTVQLVESGGKAVERTTIIPVVTNEPKIGISPSFKDGQISEGSTAEFKIIAVDGTGARIAMPGAEWSLAKVERNYQWYKTGSSWQYESIEFSTEIADGTLDLAADMAGSVAVPVGWGRYRLDVSGADGTESSYLFNAGWYVDAAATETPDGLEIALDKDSYQIGETAKLHISPRFSGEVLVTIGADRLIDTVTASVPAEGATIDLPVTEKWGAGSYITATLYRGAAETDSRMPMRAIGVRWLAVDPGDRLLSVSMDLPEQMLPRQSLTIPIRIGHLQAGEEAYVSVAAVDVGILNLTRHESANPEKWYFGQRALGLDIRDIYGRLIDGSAGTVGRIRTGGDGMQMRAEGSPPKEKLVAFFEGLIKVGADGSAEVTFDIPQFNGTVRVSAIAWSAEGVGQAEQDIIIRDPVVLTASMPQFLAPGDSSQMLVELANTDGPAGNYALSVKSAKGSVSVDTTMDMDLAKGDRKTVKLALAGFTPGEDAIELDLTGPDGITISRFEPIEVRPAAMPVTTKQIISLAGNGSSLQVDRELLVGSLLEGASVNIGVTYNSAFDVGALLMALDRYPYGCAEQTTSRVLPLLYLSELDVADRFDGEDISGRIDKAILRLVSFQSSSGSFGLWGPGSGDLWLDAYVTDFFTRAIEKGFTVPPKARQLALDNLQNTLAYTTDIQADGSGIAYALYVLARNRQASVNDLRYYVDTQLDSFTTPLARAQIGAALSLYGDQPRAALGFKSALSHAKATLAVFDGRDDYGSSLRDGAGILALAAESQPTPPIVDDLIAFVGQALEERQYTSTQENAWMVLASRAINEANARISLSVNGNQVNGSYQNRLSGDDLIAEPVTLINKGADPVEVAITTIAAPRDPLPAGGDGFSIDRKYFTLDGKPASISSVNQNERFVVVLTMSEANSWRSRVVVTDLLPGGFVIDNPRIVGSADLQNMPWLGSVSAVHAEFRSDRFVAAFDRSSGADRSFSVAYVVRAVSPGIYAHPAAVVEDMYRPEIAARTAGGIMEVKAAQ